MEVAGRIHGEVEPVPTSQSIDMAWMMKQGIFATMLCLAASWFAWYIVIPMRDGQQAFMLSVIDTNKEYAKASAKFAEVQQTQSFTLSKLTEQHNQQTKILEQIRDDQRNGAWNRKPAEREP